MAQFLLLLPLGLCLWGLKWVKGIREDCLSRNSTDALRGVLALGIILVHIAQYCPGGWGFALTWWVSGIPYDLLHGVGNFFVTLALFKPCHRVLQLLKATY